MQNQHIYKELTKHCPNGFRINEIIKFAYPFRRIRVKVTANKSPEKSLQHIYSSILQTIDAGFESEKEICRFLGLNPEDFILRELYFLREKGLSDLISDKWKVTEQGQEFIKNNDILKVIEEDDFEFLIDAKTEKVLEYEEKLFSNVSEDKKLKPTIKYNHKDESILNNKDEQLRDLYKKLNQNHAYLIDIVRNKIQFDALEFSDFLLIEYIPYENRKNELEPFIEIRKIDNDYHIEKWLTNNLKLEYPDIIYQLTSSERDKAVDIEFEQVDEIQIVDETKTTLTIWETQQQFEKALHDTKEKILIESPWIKKATDQYIPAFEKLLKDKKTLIILYGIDEKDEHHEGVLNKLRRLETDYPNYFFRVHLPTHFQNVRLNLTGTHRKLIIKDNDYYIIGSFNFLSFNKREGEKVANEESIIIRTNVADKWKQVINEYKIGIKYGG
jgi:hypothetical protein